jgi:protein TonB
VDLTLHHPTYQRPDEAPQGATLATASPVTMLATLQSKVRDSRTQFARRWAAPAVLIVALHIVGGVAVLRLVDHPPLPPTPVREVTVTLIAPPAPAIVPVAPPEPKPVPKPTPKPVVHQTPPRPQPITPPTPIMTTQAPSATTVAAPPAPPPTPPAPADTKAADAAPSAAPSHASSGAPVNVAHQSCDGAPPEYPMLSKRRGETGTAVVAITVDTQGVVRSATLRTSSGFPRLDDAALQAARERSCQPYLENGTPISATALLPFAFKLQG